MKKVKIAIVLAVSLFVCYACNKNEENAEPATESYDSPIPLKVGNYWVYDYYDYKVRDSVVTEKYNGRQKITVVGDTIINNQKYFVLNGRLGYYIPDTYPRTFIIRCSDGIVYNLAGETLTYLSVFPERVEKLVYSDTNITHKLINYLKLLHFTTSQGVQINITNVHEDYIAFAKSENPGEFSNFPATEHYINKDIGLVLSRNKFANVAFSKDSVLQQFRYETVLVDYYIQ